MHMLQKSKEFLLEWRDTGTLCPSFLMFTPHPHSHCLFSAALLWRSGSWPLYERQHGLSCPVASRWSWLTEGTKRKTKSRDVKTLTSTPTPWTLAWPGCVCHSVVRVLPGSRNHSFLSCFFWSRGRQWSSYFCCFRILSHHQVIPQSLWITCSMSLL